MNEKKPGLKRKRHGTNHSTRVLSHYVFIYLVGTTCLSLFHSIVYGNNNNSIFVEGFRYKLHAQEIKAPEMLCFSGEAPTKKGFSISSTYTDPSVSSKTNNTSWPVASRTASIRTQFSCPTTPEEVASYPAVVMDQDGYVKINVAGIRLRDDGRRRQTFEKENDRKIKKKKTLTIDNLKNKTESKSEVTKKEILTSSSKTASHLTTSKTAPHHLQIYLVNLDDYAPDVLRSQCCYELETAPPEWIEKSPEGQVILPDECKYNPSNNGKRSHNGNVTNNENSIVSAFSHDYRVNAARIRPLGFTSAPLQLNIADDKPGINVMTTLRPTDTGRYMVVISNCAADLAFDPIKDAATATGLKIYMNDIHINFVSKFGELPLSMMGIIPFYGTMTALYFLLSLIWLRQSNIGKNQCWKRMLLQRGNTFHKSRENLYIPVTLLGVQNAIRFLVFCQTGFSSLAFSYYLYLNGTSVDVNVLYSGTAAALVNWGPWSIAVALAHFGTLLACQIVVTLATDGMWLIQNTVHKSTRRALHIMISIWILFFAAYGFLTERQRRSVYMTFGIAWIIFLMSNVRRSLRHLKSLMIGQSSDQIIAVGGALVAKRSMYRKMCVIVGIYPLIFTLSFIWTTVRVIVLENPFILSLLIDEACLNFPMFNFF